MGSWQDALLVATALHAGFQVTVSAVVYPALAAVPDGAWVQSHAAHSRRIAPVVAVVYAVALVASGLAISRAGRAADVSVDVGVALAALGTLTAVLTTALVAAPLHGRLAARDEALVARLLTADRVRCVATLVALAGAVLVGV